ncbi:MAG: Asp-tRNA(Asn)/Glu-tRNA(Gln) amidotransferase subunit GatC [Chloroflexi bacterium]|nr:Asp-tRNA(Asn)/Glu-tRNA(Gln) amidotransferase subunit GatC [Chloroflexota bacterium]
MAAIDRATVEHVAALARVGLTDEEITRFAGQLSRILDAVDALQAVDTSQVSPTASVLPLDNVMREDEVRPGLTREDALANAPLTDGEFFRVQASLEER